MIGMMRALEGGTHPEWASCPGLMTWAQGVAARTFDEVGSHVQLCMLFRDDRTLLVHCGWDSDEDRSDKLANLRSLAQSWRAQRYLFISEAWRAVYDQHSAPNGTPVLAPRDREDRQEIVVIAVVDRDGTTLCAQAPILREPDQQARLGAFAVQDEEHDGAVFSFFDNTLPSTPVIAIPVPEEN